MIMRGAWMFSFSGAGYAQYDNQTTLRGDRQYGITDWEMLMAMRPVRGGMLHLHLMTSIEPFVLRGGGYPELLQNGGTYQHSYLFDRMHPHDALMELSALYEHRVAGPLAMSLYLAPVGEPAVGPVAYMHRPSAANDPFAPISHHWQDADHQSFGVATLGLTTKKFKIEASIFNPREADENHLIVDYRDAKLDAYAGRVSWVPTPRIVANAWWAFLNSHDRLDPTTRMHRFGASVMDEARGPGGGRLSTTVVWGMNLHDHGAGHDHGAVGISPHHLSMSLLAESNLELGERTSLFARAERVEKDGEELGFQGGDILTLYDVRSVVLGAVRTVAQLGRAAEIGVGARAAVNFVPSTLLLYYQTRTPLGFAVYLRVSPHSAK